MSLYDFFFPEEAQASHLREIAEQNRVSNTRRVKQSKSIERLQQQVEDLEDDLGYVTLILGAILGKLNENDVIKREDVKEAIRELDGIDGLKDGKLDVNILRGKMA